VLYPTSAGGRSTLVKWHIKTQAKLEEKHTFLGLLAKIKERVHHNSLLLGLLSVAQALHYSMGLAHPTKSS
ncbi:hypothetical protein DVH24_030862, partial [Malus domestica]